MTIFEEFILMVLIEFIPVLCGFGGVFGDDEGCCGATVGGDDGGDGGFDLGLFGEGFVWGLGWGRLSGICHFDVSLWGAEYMGQDDALVWS